MKRNLTLLSFALILGLFALAIQASAQNQPTLLKRTVNVSVKRYTRYWKTPTAAEPVYNTYGWVPQISFDVLGAIEAGSQLSAEFDTPDGKSWLSYKMQTPELEPDVQKNIRIEDTMSDDELEKKAVITEGVYPFRIRLKNALSGTNTVLFSGKYKVATYAPNQAIPEYKGKKDFYIDYDWHLPVAYVWLNPQNDQDVPNLSTQMCFRGAGDTTKLEAYLFYNGKQISKDVAGGNHLKQTMTSAADDAAYRWTIWQFDFANVAGFNHSQSANNYSSKFFLDKNTGEYEIKVLRDNQTARSLKFTVGADGKIVDTKVAVNAKLGGIRMIFPVKIVGAADGKWNATAWTSDALYSNPLAGFTAAQ